MPVRCVAQPSVAILRFTRILTLTARPDPSFTPLVEFPESAADRSMNGLALQMQLMLQNFRSWLSASKRKCPCLLDFYSQMMLGYSPTVLGQERDATLHAGLVCSQTSSH